MDYTKEFIINELSYYSEYNLKELNILTYQQLLDVFNSHCNKYAIEIEAGDLVNNHQNLNFLIDTPDGFINVGDFWEKSNKEIITIKTVDEFSATVSTDHLFETNEGWIYAGNITKNHLILTKNGYRQVSYINKHKYKETVYDWEILHKNHRYWAGNGLSSHNTGKTFLLLNGIKRAQDLGYSIIFYDSENAVDLDLVEKFGIDPRRFRYEPCNTVQEFRSSVTALTDILIEQKNKGVEIPKILIALDSAGNLATQKEIDDAKSGSDKADMTRAKLLKSAFRILMTKLGICKIPFLFTNHTYQCIWGESNVQMADGSIENIKNVKVGDLVKTLDGPKEVECVTEFKKSYVLEFELEDGEIFRCTPEHRFLVKNDYTNDQSWKTAEELREKDTILRV